MKWTPIAAAAAVLIASAGSTLAQDTAFTYQGELNVNGMPANGSYDMKFKVYTVETGGTEINTGAYNCDRFDLTDGRFTELLDFYGLSQFPNVYLEVSVREHDDTLPCDDDTGYTALPRQWITRTPKAYNADLLGGRPGSFYNSAANLTGALPNSAVQGAYTNTVQLLSSGNYFAGDGGGLRNIASAANATNADNATNATHLGGVPTATFARRDVANTFAGANTFTGTSAFNAPILMNNVFAPYTDTALAVQSPSAHGPYFYAPSNSNLTILSGGSGYPLEFAQASSTGAFSSDASSGDGVIRTSQYNNLLLQTGSGASNIFLKASDGSAHINGTYWAQYVPYIKTGINGDTGINGNIYQRGQYYTFFGTSYIQTQSARADQIIMQPYHGSGPVFVGSGGNDFPGALLQVFGGIAKTYGSFKIDHPLDPENKFLYHSFVESPDMMNIYNGTVTTDADGYATITMPDWFEALNRDFRYQLTVVDDADSLEFVQAKVVRRMEGNQFAIRTSRGGTEVSWQVTGIRHDPIADKYRIQVEVEKTVAERGKYMMPDAYGLPVERAIGYKPEDVAQLKASQALPVPPVDRE